MREHFEKFDLLPLSFSHLNEFAFYRERWALRRIFGYEFPTSASAVRGQSVESGINMFLNGIPLEEATENNCEVVTTEKDFFRIENLGIRNIKCCKVSLEVMENQKFVSDIKKIYA